MATPRTTWWHRQIEVDSSPALPALRLRRVAHIRADRTYIVPRHDYPTDRWYAMRTTAGAGEITTHGGRHFILTEDSLIVLRQASLGPFRCIAERWVMWQWEFWCDGELPLPSERVLQIAGAAREEIEADRCFLDLASGRQHRLLLASLRFAALMVAWASAEAEATAQDGRLTPALELMREDLRGDLSVATLAQRCGLSERSFRATFTSRFGCGPKRFHDRLRMLQAADQLRHTAMGIDDIATGLGYSDRFNFSKVFARVYGCPPVAFRQAERLQRNGPAHPPGRRTTTA